MNEIGNCKLCGRELTSRRRKRCNSCNTKIRRYRTKKAAIEYLGGLCQDPECQWQGEYPPSVMEFHHKSPDKKNFTIGNVSNRKWEIIKKELDQCLLVCSNCHKKKHYTRDNKDFLEEAERYNGKLLN